MARIVTLHTDMITPDVTLNGTTAVRAIEAWAFRRYDLDDQTDGLILALVKLNTVTAQALESGVLRAALVNRAGGGNNVTASYTLSTTAQANNSTLGRLLNSDTAAELNGGGSSTPIDAMDVIGTLPTGLTLTTPLLSRDPATDYEINLQANTDRWVYWGGLYGMNFSDAATMQLEWHPVA